MRVGVFFPGFPPQAGGGYTFENEILISLAKIAGESRHHFTLFMLKPFSADIVLPESKNLHIVFLIPNRDSPSLLVFLSKLHRRWWRLLVKLGWKNELEIEMNQEILFQQAVRNAKIDFLWYPTSDTIPVDIPYLATVWDIQHRLQPWFPELSANGEWERREAYFSKLLRQATFIVTGNEAGKQEISFFYQIPAERFKLLPHPKPQIDKITSNDIKNVLYKHSIFSEYLFYPAQFWAHKNHANLLFALHILRDKYQKKIQLVFTGSDQGNLQYIRKLTETMDLMDQVHFLGFVPRHELMALYSGAFALIYPTFFGPENLPPLEAFSLGCPVIASSVHGAEEQLGEAALLVNPADAGQMAAKIFELSSNAILREQLITAGYERAEKWTSPDFIRGIFTVLDEFEAIRKCWSSE